MNDSHNPDYRIKTLLICHDGAALDREGLARWLASFSDLTGVVVLRENKQRIWKRIEREFKRSGPLRFVDVLAFRLYYRFFLARRDEEWEQRKLDELCRSYPAPGNVPVLITHSPNSPEAERFIRQQEPDLVLARCKTLIKERTFSIPSKGTYVMHPGICPEYRNAHGCFWALANGDYEKIGMTLLRIDKGVDTGPIYGYYSYPYDEVNESHIVVQARVVLENLQPLERKLTEIYRGEANSIETNGRRSATWGQPWLTRYLGWKNRARKRRKTKAISIMYHDVVPRDRHATSGFPGSAALYKISPEAFDRHLQALKATRPDAPILVSDLAEFQNERGCAKVPWMLTFDDGGVSAITTIADRLDALQWRGHFFVATDYIDAPAFLSREQIRELAARGHIIGSHSCSHPLRMASCDWPTLQREWRDSVAKLSDILGFQVRIGSIPGGQFSRQVAEAAGAAGIQVLFTSEPLMKSWTVNGCLLLGRYTIRSSTLPQVAASLAAGHAVPRSTQAVLWNAKKITKMVGGEYYLKLRNGLVDRTT